MVFGIILAGGTGSRMNFGDMPKQFLKLKDKPIIILTLEKMLAADRIDKIIIGVHRDWVDYTKELCEQYWDAVVDEKVFIVAGGHDRNDSLMHTIKFIDARFVVGEGDIMVTHDAVRPFYNERIINDNIDAANKYGACGTMIACHDSLAISQNGEIVENIPDRGEFYHCQTPQSFNIKLFCRCYNSLSDDEKATLTEACSICVQASEKVGMVVGDELNFKITTKSDFKMASALMEII